ncbi:MAG TPA: hypothetical protein VFC02_28195 [Anaerolineales bacterium]|jgi:hypothetical protein|nr:hypothetical protein [Anaerolineales bacterium]
MHKLRHEPRAYEYLPLPEPMREVQREQLREGNEQAGLGIFFLGMLSALLRLPEVEEFTREGGKE